ncbi:uncharacterized protein LOC126804762 [Argentina anserina]|uniref:uncharacterized protein LOC126804762 n=1 Tax=Argentina anserina TaxID=57926 RepID=UPI0021763018|nr:uncharacterized protein LOC126804762 [Potentilla anserina]
MKKLSKKKVKERRKLGIVKAYVSRANAIRKLQIPLSDFRRLCILKGVYPVEPKNKSKLTGANTRRKTYFYTRDIQFLMNDPLIHKFWEFKIFMKRLTKAKGRHDLEKFNKVNEAKPIYKLDTIVKERYPRFVDALRDCDDALSMCFLFAMFPKGRGRPDDLIDLSRKLTLEFLHYVIASKSLRKVFITIKGYYYQAEIMSQTITWIVPHQFVIDRVSNVDLNVMKTFAEFYVTLLGFINYKLFKSINAVYPPEFAASNILKTNGTDNSSKIKQNRKRKHLDDDSENEDEELLKDEMTATLNKQIKILENKSLAEAEKSDQQLDVFEEEEEGAEEKAKEDKMTLQQVIALERLFSGMKFFLNREVPRESLTFVIRSLGGEVSWDKNLYPGATFDESDPDIKYQIVDRESVAERRLDRTFIQPQWIYDSLNMRMLLPTDDYLMGAKLPPHLSPFVNEKKGEYVPPDKTKMLNLRKQFEADMASEDKVNKGEGGVESELETDAEFEKEVDDQESDSEVESAKRRQADADEKKAKKMKVNEINKSNKRSKMAVKKGKLKIEDKEELKKKEDAEHRKMGIMMIPKKKKRLFDKITRTKKQKSMKTQKMKNKRKIVEAIATRQKQKSDKKFANKTKAR